MCLAALSGCMQMEWRGSMFPHLGIKKDDGQLSQGERPSGSERSPLRNIPAGWPQFRGPSRDGVVADQGISLRWNSPPPVRWKVPAGEGHSSVVISGRSALSMEQDGQNEILISRSLEDGSTLWKHPVKTRWEDFMSGPGPRTTPTLSAGRVYGLYSNGLLTCLDAVDGKVVWTRKVIEDEYEFPDWGISCSPLVWNDLVILGLGGKTGAAKAYHATTGKPAWKSELSGKGVYLSPVILNLLGAKHLIIGMEGTVAGLDPTSGSTLWKKPWKIFLNNAQIAQPLALSKNSFLLSAGYGKGAECLSLSSGANVPYLLATSWKSKNLKSKFSNPVFKDGFIYGLNENSLTCLDSSTGELKWRGKKYGYGRVLLSSGKLIILGNTGVLSVVEANPEKFVEIYSGQLLSDLRCWNGPALAGGYLVARNSQEMACFDLAKTN